MHVESVAWAAELKDLLYTLFFLASYISYLKYLKEQKRVAAGEDLEVITNSRKWPPFLKKVKDPKRGFKEETTLHVLGYKLTDITPVQRWNILTNVAIPILGPLEVGRSIANLIYSRLPNPEIAERSRNAILEWKKDLDAVLEKFADDEEIKKSNLAQYVKNIDKKMTDLLRGSL